MAARTAIVVGGGIAGLAAAIALHQGGWRVRVLERSPRLAEVGAGISLWPNALRALDEIGVGEAIRALGGVEFNSGIRGRDGRWLARADADELSRRFGNVLILHRADLLQVLADTLPAGVLETDHNVSPSMVDSLLDEAELVVGADGIGSAVRRAGWPDAAGPRYAGYTAWRLITRPLPTRLHEAGESWGAGCRVGYASLPDRRVYCYATANEPEGATSTDGLADLRARFGDWHEPIPTLLAAAEPGAVLRHDMYDLPALPSYVHPSHTRGRLVLVGDAAHAMTPNLGQGACQALEDVATLARLLRHSPTDAALVQYDRLRRRHTQKVARLSRRVGTMGQWSAPLAVALRDRLMPLLPASALARSLAPILNWRLPN